MPAHFDKPLIFAAIAVVTILLLLFLSNFHVDHMVTSTVDKETYIVEEDFENKQAAANILAKINQMYVRIIKHLKKNIGTGRWSREIAFLVSNYNPTVLGEHIPTDLKYTSYVSQKGKKIRLCLRKPENRHVFHDMATIKFVALHELTHMMVASYGHEEEFWDAFRFILLEAAAMGEISIIDYSKHPVQYCGISIVSNPAV